MKLKKIFAILMSTVCLTSSLFLTNIHPLFNETQSVICNAAVKWDVNGNGKIDLYDAILIARFLVKPSSLTEAQKKVADCNGDNKIDLYDAIEIAKYLAKSSSTKPSASTGTSSSIPSVVYYTKTGKCYHYSNTCNGGTYYQCSYDEAVNKRKLKPCGKCVN